MNEALLAKLGLAAGDRVRVRQGAGEALLTASVDRGVPASAFGWRQPTRRPPAWVTCSASITVERA